MERRGCNQNSIIEKQERKNVKCWSNMCSFWSDCSGKNAETKEMHKTTNDKDDAPHQPHKCSRKIVPLNKRSVYLFMLWHSHICNNETEQLSV